MQTEPVLYSDLGHASSNVLGKQLRAGSDGAFSIWLPQFENDDHQGGTKHARVRPMPVESFCQWTAESRS